MLDTVSLIEAIIKLNDEIENGIDDLSIIEKLSVETEGDTVQIKLGGIMYWTDEKGEGDEEINNEGDLMEILLEKLLHRKTQVDGMIKLFKNKLKHHYV